MFTRLCEHKLKAKCGKYRFANACVKYLGHAVGSDELRVDPDKVSAVAEWATTCDIKGV